jgi:hypothetical protein
VFHVGRISGYEIIAFLTTILQGLKKHLLLFQVNRLRMRSYYIAALAGVFILGLPALPAFAQGSVLVPQDYTPPSQTLDDQGNPIPIPQPSYQPSLPKLDPNVDDTGGSTPELLSPIPTNNGNDGGQSSNDSPIWRDTPIPTQVLKMPSSEAPSMPGDEYLPENVKITIKDYMWGPQDIDTVNQVLHIAKDQVPKICRLSLIGTLRSDTEQSSYPFNMGSTYSNVIVYYDGKSSGINILARALCDRVPLPPNSGLIMQSGDKYSVLINTTQCPPPPASGQTLVFKYAGNGGASCVYQ